MVTVFLAASFFLLPIVCDSEMEMIIEIGDIDSVQVGDEHLAKGTSF